MNLCYVCKVIHKAHCALYICGVLGTAAAVAYTIYYYTA